MIRKYHKTIIDLGVVCGLFLAFAFSFDQSNQADAIATSAIFFTTAAILGIVYTILTIEKRIKAIECKDREIEDLIDKLAENKQLLAEIKQQQNRA